MPQFCNSTTDYRIHQKTPILKFQVLLSQSSLHPQQWENSLTAARVPDKDFKTKRFKECGGEQPFIQYLV